MFDLIPWITGLIENEKMGMLPAFQLLAFQVTLYYVVNKINQSMNESINQSDAGGVLTLGTGQIVLLMEETGLRCWCDRGMNACQGLGKIITGVEILGCQSKHILGTGQYYHRDGETVVIEE